MKIAIVEDEPAEAEKLRGFIEKYCAENGIEQQCTHFPDGLALVEDYRPDWDIVFLDIMMPHLDGMRAAAKIRETDNSAVLIFVTNMARYAVKGYEVDAADFILKPISYAPFSMKFRKAVNLAKRRERRCITVSEDGISHRLAADDILFAEVYSHRLHIHTSEREYISRGTLDALEEQLSGLSFARCNVSYLVNLRNVLSVGKDTVTVPGHTLTMSRGKKKEFLAAFSEYIGGSFQ